MRTFIFYLSALGFAVCVFTLAFIGAQHLLAANTAYVDSEGYIRGEAYNLQKPALRANTKVTIQLPSPSAESVELKSRTGRNATVATGYVDDTPVRVTVEKDDARNR